MVVHHWSDDGMVMYHRRSLITNLREDKSYTNAWALMMSARFPVPSDDQAEASCLIRQIRKLTSAVTTCVLLRQNTNFGED